MPHYKHEEGEKRNEKKNRKKTSGELDLIASRERKKKQYDCLQKKGTKQYIKNMEKKTSKKKTSGELDKQTCCLQKKEKKQE